MKTLVIATANLNKFKEIKKILGISSLSIKFLLDFRQRPCIVEDGKSFFENAKRKAEITSSFYDCLAIGEDSGLQVNALKGKPGIFSSRFAGEAADDKKNITKLLRQLRKVPFKKRKACFRCCAVLAYKGKTIKKFEGTISGVINFEPKGSSGFGYDPVFFVPTLKKTLAQVPISVKNKISHRYKAISKLKKYLANSLKKYNSF